MNLNTYKEAIREIVTFAINEYGSRSFIKPVLVEEKYKEIQFGSLQLSASLKLVGGRMQLLQMDIFTTESIFVCSMLLGQTAMLFNKSASGFRQELVDEKRIAGVASLKQRVFEHPVSPASIILLGEKEVSQIWFAAIENIDQLVSVMCGIVDDTWKVYYSNKVCADNFLPEYYNGDDQIVENVISGSEIKKLSDIAAVIPGKSANRNELPISGIPYIRGRDLKNGSIVAPRMFVDPKNVQAYSRQLLQEGDILLTKQFGQNKLALVKTVDLPAVASDGLYIIRPYDVSEKYLYRYLTSKTGYEVFSKQLNRVAKGSLVPSIRLSELVHIKVPVFDEKTMDIIDNLDSISGYDALEVGNTLVNSSMPISEKNISEQVYASLLAAGWDSNGFFAETNSELYEGSTWRPDFVYSTADGRKIVIEIKTDLTRIDNRWFSAINSILRDNCIYILSTGVYFEVHVPGIAESFKSIEPPHLNSIFEWEKGVR